MLLVVLSCSTSGAGCDSFRTVRRRRGYRRIMAPGEDRRRNDLGQHVGPAAGAHAPVAGERGGYSALAREDGTNELATHATLHPIYDDEAEARADLPLFLDLSDESTSDQKRRTSSQCSSALRSPSALSSSRRMPSGCGTRRPFRL